MNTERATRFLEALSALIGQLPWWTSTVIIGAQLFAALVWFGALRLKLVRSTPGAPLGLIYMLSPFYIFILGAALYSALFPDGLQDVQYMTYGGLLVLICAAVFSFGFWLFTEPLPPSRFVPRWVREDVNRAREAKKYADPPTSEHDLRRVQSKPRERR